MLQPSRRDRTTFAEKWSEAQRSAEQAIMEITPLLRYLAELLLVDDADASVVNVLAIIG